MHIWQVAADAGHTKMFTWDSNFWDPKFWMEMTVWGFFGARCLPTSLRMEAIRSSCSATSRPAPGRLMTRSLMFSAFLTIPVMMLLYFLGLGFFAYYHAPENAALLASLNELVARKHGDNHKHGHAALHLARAAIGAWGGWCLRLCLPPRCRCFPRA